jgi:predicted small integral membrane protein
MNWRSLNYNWTEEDRLTWVSWRRRMAVFYGCAALLIFGIIVLTKPSSPTPDQASSSLAARGNPGADLSGKAQ